LLLVFIICVVNYMDRGTLPVANRLIRNELGLSVAEMGVFVAVASISVAVFFGFSSSGTSWSLANACAPSSYAASLGAIMDFGGFIGGALTPMVTGFVVQATGSFTPALLVAGAIGLCSAGAYVVGIPGEPIPTKALAPSPA